MADPDGNDTSEMSEQGNFFSPLSGALTPAKDKENFKFSDILDLDFKKESLSDIKFLLKYLKNYPKVKSIDLSTQNLLQEDLTEFAKILKENCFITKVLVSKDCVRWFKEVLKTQMDKNKTIWLHCRNYLY